MPEKTPREGRFNNAFEFLTGDRNNGKRFGSMRFHLSHVRLVVYFLYKASARVVLRGTLAEIS